VGACGRVCGGQGRRIAFAERRDAPVCVPRSEWHIGARQGGVTAQERRGFQNGLTTRAVWNDIRRMFSEKASLDCRCSLSEIG